jgi:FdhD protein
MDSERTDDQSSDGEFSPDVTPEGSAFVTAKISRCEETGRLASRTDFISVEEPLEIRIRGRGIAVTMRTPGHDRELAAGFLVSEGIIRERADVVDMAFCQQGEAVQFRNILNVFLSPSVTVNFEQLTRHVFASSSCGLCGKASIEAVQQHFKPAQTVFTVSPETLLALPDRCRSAQETFDKTGGLHAAALFDSSGRLIVVREDVGRHNAVDKVIGCGFLDGQLPLDRQVLFVSGRASFEIMQKALSAGIGFVAAVSAPSSLAVEFARESGQTLVGFLRSNTFNIYAHAHRVGKIASART